MMVVSISSIVVHGFGVDRALSEVKDAELEKRHLQHGSPLPVVVLFQSNMMGTWRRMQVVLTW
jgi:hypothetical protein